MVLVDDKLIDAIRASTRKEAHRINSSKSIKLPEVVYFSGKTDTTDTHSRFDTGLDLSKETGKLNDMVARQDTRTDLLGACSEVRKTELEIYGVRKGTRDDGRDFLLSAREIKREDRPSQNLEDLRLLLGVEGDEGAGLMSDAMSLEFAAEVDIPVYSMRVVRHKGDKHPDLSLQA